MFAQHNIDRLVKQLEEKGVNVNTVIKRNSNKKIYLSVKSLSFYSKEGNYARQLQKAFDMDANDAVNANTNKEAGYKTISLIFSSGTKKKIYTLYISGKETRPYVNVNILNRDNSISSDDDSSFLYDIGNNSKVFDWSTFEKNMKNIQDYDWTAFNKRMKDFENYDWSAFNKKMEKMKDYDWSNIKKK
jgi:hypothetical protein